MDGAGVSINAVGVVASGSICPFVFESLAAVSWEGRLIESISSDCKMPFCG